MAMFSHRVIARSGYQIKLQTLKTLVVSALWLGATGVVTTASAAISETITVNKISTPAYIVDYQKSDGDATTLNNGLKTSVTAQFSRTIFDSQFTGSYRVICQLVDDQGIPLKLANSIVSDATKTVSASFSVPPSDPLNHSKTLDIYPDPVATLDNESAYTVIASLQHSTVFNVWNDVAGSALDSGAEYVHHFTQPASGDPEYNIRATVKNLRWTRRYALATSASKNAFQASIDVDFARFDDWEDKADQQVTRLTLDFDLIEQSSGISVPLVNDGIVSQIWEATSYLKAGKFDPLAPDYKKMDITADLTPVGQLKSGSETYIVRCTVKHQEVFLGTYVNAAPELNSKGLLHFNGDLLFGAVTTQFDDLGNNPVFGATGADRVFTVIRVPVGSGSFPQNANYVFGSNVNLLVLLYDNGQSVIRPGSNTELVRDPLDALAPVTYTSNNLNLTYGPVTLSDTGASAATVEVTLPQGNIYLANTTLDSQRGVDTLFSAFPQSLNGSLNLAGDLDIQFGNDSAMVDESQPLLIRTKRVTVTPTGRLVYGDLQGVSYIHAAAYNKIESEVSSGTSEPFDDDGRKLDERASNDRYWKTINAIASAEVTISAATDASARMTASFDLDPQSFETHFPAYVAVDWQGASTIALVEGAMDSGVRLNGVNTVDVPYFQTCPADPCATTVPKEPQTLKPDDGRLALTLSGGLYQTGDMVVTKFLAWGARGDGAGGIDPSYPYAHRTTDFDRGDIYIPGYQLYATDNPLLTTAPYAADAGDNAPGALLLAGFNGDTASQQLYFPTDSSYTDGDGFYPGLNVSVDTVGRDGASRIGGNTVDYAYELVSNGASKYYTRCAGVFGRQVAKDGTFNPSLNIYGYDFELNSFQVTFIASEQLDKSWINGAIAVTGHSEFTQRFNGLSLTCLGELDGATIDPDDNKPKDLVYWDSQFTPLAINFETALKSAPGDCPQLFTGYLTMGVSTQVAHIPNQLYGTFAFDSANGNLLTQETGAEIGIDSELGIPANLNLDGPSKDYTLVTTGKLRFSNPVKDPNSQVGLPGGFITFGATINVPYFKDFQVQVITSAHPSSSALVYLTPGWTDAGKTFFSSTHFDPGHTSWPQGSIGLGEYKTPDTGTADTFLIKAEQDLFGIVPLSYPLKWDDGVRSFASMNPQNEELLILKVDHQVDYLDAAATKVSFGVKYEGLPEISLVNMLNSQIDGAAGAVSGAISAPLKGAIDAAFDEFDKMLADSLDSAIDPIVDEAATQVLNPLYDELKMHYDLARSQGDDWATFKVKLDSEIAGRIYTSGNGNAGLALGQQLQKLSDTAEDAASLTADLQSAIEQIIIGIDSITAQVEVVGSVPQFNIDPNLAAGSPIPGLLKKSGGERQIVQTLVTLLLQDLLDEDIAAILVPLLNSATSDLNAELNALLKEIDPALEHITAALLQVREFLVEVHTQIANNTGFISDFQALVADASNNLGEFKQIQEKPAIRALAYIEDLARDNGIDLAGGGTVLNQQLDLFEEFSKEQFVAAVKTELKDAILESELIRQYQFLLRQTFYDLENKMEQTVASVLSQISGVMKDLVSDTIGSLEEEINPLLGNMNDYMGAAEVTGYADFNGDSLRKVRMDASMQFKMPDEMQLNTFLEINAYTSEDGGNACVDPGEKAVEVTVGATDVPLDWISDGLRANLAVKMSLTDQGSGMRPNGLGGDFSISDGILDFQAFQIIKFGATMAISDREAYVGCRATGIFDSYEISIGVFFGRTCSVDPLLLVDEDVGSLFSDTLPLTGAYVYGEVWLPISEIMLGIPASCLFNISAGVGTGVGFFLNDSFDPIFVGKMFAGVSGEALCVVSIKGTVTMVGIVQDGSFSASGTGRLKGKAGACPFCIKFSASAKISYSDGDWDVDY